MLHDVPAVVEVIENTAKDGPHSREPKGESRGSWSTQLRLVDLVSRMFGLQALETRIRVANAFDIPLTDLIVASKTQGCRDRATALMGLLRGLTDDDLLALGALMDCWGPPYRWHTDRDQLWDLPWTRGPPTTLGRSDARLNR